MTKEAGKVLELLTKGRALGTITPKKPILSRDIAATLHFDGKERDVRKAVSELRCMKYWIAAGNDGYFFAETFEEIEPTIKTLKSKAKETFRPAMMMLQNASLEKQLELSFDF